MRNIAISMVLGILVMLKNEQGMYFPRGVETLTQNQSVEIHIKKGGKKVFEFPLDEALMVVKTVHPERITKKYMTVKVNK